MKTPTITVAEFLTTALPDGVFAYALDGEKWRRVVGIGAILDDGTVQVQFKSRTRRMLLDDELQVREPRRGGPLAPYGERRPQRQIALTPRAWAFLELLAVAHEENVSDAIERVIRAQPTFVADSPEHVRISEH